VKSVSAPITLSSGDTIGVGISIGMAEYADDVESVATLLAHADQALYQAKKQNEKRWEMFVGIR
jgi:diguanylate cyclase (GGDEF)-like protein